MGFGLLLAVCGAAPKPTNTLLAGEKLTKLFTPGPYGPYPLTTGALTCDTLDVSQQPAGMMGQTLYATYPVSASGETFPVIVYAHGADGTDPNGTYPGMMNVMASWGFVVLMVQSCTNPGGTAYAYSSPPCVTTSSYNVTALDPCTACFGRYWEEQLKAVKCAQSSDATSQLPIDPAKGAVVAGHSTGGEATLFSAAFADPSYNLKAAVLQHYGTAGGYPNGQFYPAEHAPPVPTVPLIAFTGQHDCIAYSHQSLRLYDRAVKMSNVSVGVVRKIGTDHHEPANGVAIFAEVPNTATGALIGPCYISPFNPYLGFFSIAWINAHIPPAKLAAVLDWNGLIFGTGPNSVCHGGDGDMAECRVRRGA